MTNDQQNFCHELLALSYRHGFHLYPLPYVLERAGLPRSVLCWNECQQNGLLWDFHPRSNSFLRGMLIFDNRDGGSSGAASRVGINPDTLHLIEECCGYRRVQEQHDD